MTDRIEHRLKRLHDPMEFAIRAASAAGTRTRRRPRQRRFQFGVTAAAFSLVVLLAVAIARIGPTTRDLSQLSSASSPPDSLPSLALTTPGYAVALVEDYVVGEPGASYRAVIYERSGVEDGPAAVRITGTAEPGWAPGQVQSDDHETDSCLPAAVGMAGRDPHASYGSADGMYFRVDSTLQGTQVITRELWYETPPPDRPGATHVDMLDDVEQVDDDGWRSIRDSSPELVTDPDDAAASWDASFDAVAPLLEGDPFRLIRDSCVTVQPDPTE